MEIFFFVKKIMNTFMLELYKGSIACKHLLPGFGLMQTWHSKNSAGWATAQNIILQGISIERRVPDYLAKNHQYLLGAIMNNHHTIFTQKHHKVEVIPWNF